MKKKIIINVSSTETRIAILEDGDLVELYVERPENERMVGDIYKGKVENVVQAIQAAFVNIGLEQNGFLSFQDVGKEYSALAERVGRSGKKSSGKRIPKQSRGNISLKVGQEILVQVTKEPIGEKGTRLTSSISLPGRFIVLVPHENMIGVSRKIANVKERRRLRLLAKSMRPQGFGLIIRTVAMGKDAQTLKADLDNLLRTWKKIEEKNKNSAAPELVFQDMGITSSVIRDLFSPDIDQLIVDSRRLYGKIKKYLKEVAPVLLPKLELYKDKTPVFDAYKIEEEIQKSLSRKIWMKSGGYIIFDQTEAMVVIDVNSGRSIREKDHELNALKTDMQAARTIAKQLRLRDSGGLIVIDFIDLAKDADRKKVVSAMHKELKKDRAAFDILPMSDFGIVQLTRERIRPSLIYQYSEPCPRCDGLGRILAKSAVISMIERQIQQVKSEKGLRRLSLRVNPDIAAYLKQGVNNRLSRLQFKFFVVLKLVEDKKFKDDQFVLEAYKIRKNGK
ncbi:ribonuclease E/G [bacterium]